MFALVKLYFVCPMSSIHKTDQGMACTKFKDGLYYDIDVVTTHGSFDVLEKLKNSLCSHSPRVALSRCDVDPSIQHEPQEFELGTIKHEMIKQEICTEEELASTSTNGHLEFDTVMGTSSLNEPTPTEIHFVDHLSSSAVAQELVVVDDIFSENTHRNILHDHCYMLQSGRSGGKIDSRVASNNPALHEVDLDEHQTVVEETESEQGSSERFPVYIMHQDGAEVGMDWHSRSVPTPTSEILNSDLDFNNVIEEEIVVKTEETDEVIIPTNESDVNNQDFDCMPIKKEEIIEENFSEELTSADSAQSYGEGSSCEVENQNRMSGISMKRHFCVYCKKLYTHLPRHLERIHHDEEAVKQFSSLPRDSVQSYGEAASCEVENQNRVSIAKNKRYFCVYCKELYTNLPRHLERIHHDEEAVKQFHCLPKGSEQRRTILNEMLRRSSYIYNTNRKYNNGELLVARRPARGKPCTANDFAPCAKCKVFYSKRSVRKHQIRCKANANRRIQGSPLVGIPDEQTAWNSDRLLQKYILPFLKDRELVKAIQHDNLAVAYGNYLCVKYKNPEQHKFIRSSLRYMGRLLIAIKRANPSIADLASLIVHSHVKTVWRVIETLAEVDENAQNQYPCTSVRYLKRVCTEAAEVWKMECLKNNDSMRFIQAEKFLKRFNEQSDVIPSQFSDARRKWSTATKTRFFKLFEEHLENKKLPSNEQCRMAMEKLPSLQSKTVAAVKTAIFNEIRRRERVWQKHNHEVAPDDTQPVDSTHMA